MGVSYERSTPSTAYIQGSVANGIAYGTPYGPRGALPRHLRRSRGEGWRRRGVCPLLSLSLSLDGLVTWYLSPHVVAGRALSSSVNRAKRMKLLPTLTILALNAYIFASFDCFRSQQIRLCTGVSHRSSTYLVSKTVVINPFTAHKYHHNVGSY